MKNWIFGILLALAPGAGFAEEIYKCDMKSESRYGWISNVVFFSPQIEEDAYVVVYDAFTKKIYDAPVRARITEQSDRVLKFAWEVEGIELSHGKRRVTASYSASYNRQSGKLSLTAYLPGMDMIPPRGTGACELLKGKKK